ncbi:hypothetical protein [Paenibacillus macerans]|uniref:hypothetical protein n=1 Tax=Paenibacillus macerans TaxID=44252 RepID=UPI0037C52C59
MLQFMTDDNYPVRPESLARNDMVIQGIARTMGSACPTIAAGSLITFLVLGGLLRPIDASRLVW